MVALMIGNPREGFRCVGPFANPSHASEWAMEWLDSFDWWVIQMKKPEEHTNE